nr:galactosylgalactosylxylosylprotein 3-beta-glucuronosyltransferase 3-like [Hydra vulgaris]
MRLNSKDRLEYLVQCIGNQKFIGTEFTGWRTQCVDMIIDRNSNSSIKFTVQEIESLKKQLNAFELKLKKKELKTIYLVTPTYHRLTQQADLVRMSNTLKLVESIHWIVIEDSNKKTDLVKNILEDSSIKYTQLYVSTSNDLVRLNSDPRWKKHRGVDQRNLGLKWLRENITGQINDGVVYFADDDNTYHEKLFMECHT